MDHEIATCDDAAREISVLERTCLERDAGAGHLRDALTLGVVIDLARDDDIDLLRARLRAPAANR